MCEYIGETRKMDTGLQAEIIEFRDFYDIDVKLENGLISNHQKYMDFVSGDSEALGFDKHIAVNEETDTEYPILEPAILYDYLYLGDTKEYGKRRN